MEDDVGMMLVLYLVNQKKILVKYFLHCSSWQTCTSVTKLMFIFVINCLFSSLFQLTTCTVLNGTS